MGRKQFLDSFFRIITFLMPSLMMVKSMIDKKFQNITSEILVLVIIAIIGSFLIGFKIGGRKEDG